MLCIVSFIDLSTLTSKRESGYMNSRIAHALIKGQKSDFIKINRRTLLFTFSYTCNMRCHLATFFLNVSFERPDYQKLKDYL